MISCTLNAPELGCHFSSAEARDGKRCLWSGGFDTVSPCCNFNLFKLLCLLWDYKCCIFFSIATSHTHKKNVAGNPNSHLISLPGVAVSGCPRAKNHLVVQQNWAWFHFLLRSCKVCSKQSGVWGSGEGLHRRETAISSLLWEKK